MPSDSMSMAYVEVGGQTDNYIYIYIISVDKYYVGIARSTLCVWLSQYYVESKPQLFAICRDHIRHGSHKDGL